MTFKTLKEAEEVVGTFGRPSKMPGYAYGIPARYCLIGSILAKRPGSVCSDCYALKGRYVFPNVQASQERRFKSLRDPRWVEAISFMINTRKLDYFRWHDSGDLQGLWHLENIVEVAKKCPDTKFWLPTREKKFVHQYMLAHLTFPPNLCVRISGTMIDGPAPQGFTNTSTVSRDKAKVTCPSHKQGNKCGTCRACWNTSVQNVTYLKH